MILALWRYLQAVGQWHQDVMKAHNHTATTCTPQQGGGAYFGSALGNGPWGSGTTSTVGGSETCPRTYAVLGCVYVRRI